MEATDVSAWLDLLSQATRFITLDMAGGTGLIVERFEGREAVNEDFRFTLDCLSASAYLDLKPLLGQPVVLGLATATGGRRCWHGHIAEAAALGADGGLARYRLVMTSALTFLRLRRNTLIFQDKTALEVVALVAADHPQLRLRTEVSAALRVRPICTQYRETDFDFIRRLLGEEGLSWRFEHDPGDTRDGPAHTLVIFDTDASQHLLAGTPAQVRFHRVDATETEDALESFLERRALVPDRFDTASWQPAQLRAVAGSAQAAPIASAPALPGLDVFEADRSARFDDEAQARRHATHRLDALRLGTRTFRAQGAVRTLEAGKTYTLREHPTLDGLAFVPLALTHVATNNLASELTHLQHAGLPADFGHGSYRQRLEAVPAGTPIAPCVPDRPLAPGCSTALVVGVPDEALTATRDHQVRVQFYWQRGTAPIAGGLTHTASRARPEGHAPGDHRSGTWVRVAELAAGADHGHVFVPRIGTEVLIEYAHGDIDQPLVVGQLYNGRAAPPFAAGEGSDANHPGTLTGLRTRSLDGQPGGTWLMDDASGQLRHVLAHPLADSRLQLGYLIDGLDRHRGTFLGEGFALSSDGWAVVRAGQGLLVSATARPQGAATQMDGTEARAQLEAAADTARRLHQAATGAGALGLSGNTAQTDLGPSLDPAGQGRYHGPVGGQPATRPGTDRRQGGAPVERFASPALLLDSPQRLALTSAMSSALFAAEHLHLTAQRDAQLSAGATLAAASASRAGLYAAQGGLKAIANHGPVSLEAHTDTLQVLADASVTLTSTQARIDILAQRRIVLQAGASTLTLEGQDITFACPGQFLVKSQVHAWMAGDADQPAFPAWNDTPPLTGAHTLDFSD
ncbi:MAG: type VI secretion system Vgr family protein [Fulvimonas sp.]|nr:type VI secretion system Vgr family protein [Fulvimonas sp.]